MVKMSTSKTDSKMRQGWKMFYFVHWKHLSMWHGQTDHHVIWCL